MAHATRKKPPRWDLGGRDPEGLLVEALRDRGEGPWTAAWSRLRKNRLAWWSLRFLCALVALSLAAPLLPLPSPKAMPLIAQAHEPVLPWSVPGKGEFQDDYWELGPIDRGLVAVRMMIFGKWQTGPWLGTDSKGRDLLARIIWGSRTSLLVALAAATVSMVIGVAYGAIAGLKGGKTDRLMMRLLDVLYSLPFIFVVIFVLAILNAPRRNLEEPLVDREHVFFLLIGAVYWLTMARVVRGQVLSLRKREFVEAARVLGASTPRILFAHIVPNVLSIVIVYLTLTIPAVMLFEAFLSFLGLGIEPPKVSLGLLAVDGTEAINPLRIYWWLVVWPAAAMGSVLLALNVLGDGLRDALDPKLRGKV